MTAGVTFEDPETAYVGADVKIGEDTTIGPNTHLRGATVIGRGCRIDGNAYLEDARLGDEVHLKFGVVITDSQVGDQDEIGPFAHLRPGTMLAARVRIGNFVETKKAQLGPGTKANHLSYLGDVTIGEQTNVGAGTITCNYDGFRKHPTVIGDRVQIGSDTQLVAPVEVGSDAYIGAGTTVTRTVPDGALVISRVKQRTVSGWVARRRARETPGAGRTAVPRVAAATHVPERRKRRVHSPATGTSATAVTGRKRAVTRTAVKRGKGGRSAAGRTRPRR
jgi:bifunctional UDP-N-acetylglucosamine pyrophosphorylase/glucosamine-1-phosphate N-acetyltransferase